MTCAAFPGGIRLARSAPPPAAYVHKNVDHLRDIRERKHRRQGSFRRRIDFSCRFPSFVPLKQPFSFRRVLNREDSL
jgi:hypothetical protein